MHQNFEGLQRFGYRLFQESVLIMIQTIDDKSDLSSQEVSPNANKQKLHA